MIIETVLQKYKLAYKVIENGTELEVRCPFHKDRGPSLNISTATGAFYCHGCKASGGSIFQFVRRLTGEDIPDSEIVTSGEMLSFTLANIYRNSAETILHIESSIQRTSEIREVFDTFGPALDHPESREYLLGRKFTEETVRNFEVRYCGHGEYKGRVIIPYFRGPELLGFNGRLIGTDKSSGKELRYRYCINQKAFRDYIYNIECATGDSCCILVEGPFDLMYAVQCGLRNVISTLSTRVSIDHIDTIRRFRKIIFMFDSDRKGSGETAAIDGARKILNMFPDREVYMTRLPGFKDPNECSVDEIRGALRELRRIRLA